MREEIAIVALAIILLFAHSFLHHTAYIEPVNNSPEIPSAQPPAMNSNQGTSQKETMESQDYATDVKEEGNTQQEEIEKNQTQNEDYNQTCEKTSQNEELFQNANYTSPPDGRIYLTEDEPYPYTPTQTPKGWGNLPVLPPKIEG